jgi:regulation of enolase protein 1 (concanavalin A-like superfamily)
MRKRSIGQALVEFALVFPILLAIMLSIVDGAFVFQGYLAVSHAAREAARFAVVYQPIQGECLHRTESGGPVAEPWPYCPVDLYEHPGETEDEYYTRRVALIRRAAYDAAVGLRISEPTCIENDDNACLQDNISEPGMFGVRVWGFQSFESSEEEHKPGLPGLPVRVQVIHNVPLVVYGAFLPNAMVQVSSSASMINEGIQVGFGNQAPPTFSPPVAIVPPDPSDPPPTDEPTEEPTEEPTGEPTLPAYSISLSPADATNLLPDEREHALTARVTDAEGQSVAGARVTFRTDAGSFQRSGTGGTLHTSDTAADGRARTVIYANEPVTASIQAWLDYDYDNAVDGPEPVATARKIWQVRGPYLVVSNHNPAPNEVIAVDGYDHPSADPVSLWWCPTDSLSTTQVTGELATGITIEDGRFADIPVTVPATSAGTYRIESHRDTGSDSCGIDSTLIAVSADIDISVPLPDLIITDIETPDLEAMGPGLPLTLTITVANQSLAPVTTGPFDIDTYVDLADPPQTQQFGDTKQWLLTLGPGESTEITTTITLYSLDVHTVWVQVDTTNYVEEEEIGGEDNNVASIEIELLDCIPIEGRDDDFSAGLDGSRWSSADIGGSSPGYTQVSGGQLRVGANGSNIWDRNDSFRYVYQAPVSGDFRATVHVVKAAADSPSRPDWPKTGLMVRDSTARNASNVFALTSNAYLSWYVRSSTGGSTGRVDGNYRPYAYWPVYLRIERENSSYRAYFSPDGESWTQMVGVHTVSALDDAYIGLAATSYNQGVKEAVFDDFELCRPTGLSGVEPPPPEVPYPYGLKQCSELIRVSGFEGNPATVFEYWRAGDDSGLSGAYQRTSAEFYRGSFSMRLHASPSVIPCSANQLQPYLYQDIELPTEVYSHSTLVVTGRYLPMLSILECSWDDTEDAGDTLNLSLRHTNNAQIVAPQQILTGDPVGSWTEETVSLESGMGDPTDYAGQTLRLMWEATNDGDHSGTFFYIDEISAQLCTEWARPDDEGGMATIGGLITTRGENNVPTAMPGTDVWAYSQGTDVLHTQAIHDGTYGFYNVSPGTYVIYAEAWVGGELRTVSTSVTVGADERRTDVNLLLQ